MKRFDRTLLDSKAVENSAISLEDDVGRRNSLVVGNRVRLSPGQMGRGGRVAKWSTPPAAGALGSSAGRPGDGSLLPFFCRVTFLLLSVAEGA